MSYIVLILVYTGINYKLGLIQVILLILYIRTHFIQWYNQIKCLTYIHTHVVHVQFEIFKNFSIYSLKKEGNNMVTVKTDVFLYSLINEKLLKRYNMALVEQY